MNRPDHDDFWLMAEVLQDLDAAADDSVDMDRIIGNIDMESLAYVAHQRALRVQGSWPTITLATIGGTWVDGFIAGRNFQKRQAKKDSNPTG
jgi:hypothetical protein